MTNSKQYIGEFEELVLLAILSVGESAYGLTIHDAIESATHRSVSVGALYTTLSRLEEKGLVCSWTGDPTPKRGGRVKRYYKVEGAGQRLLRESEASRRRLKQLQVTTKGVQVSSL